MQDTVLEPIAELLAVLVEVGAMVFLAVLGVLAESAGLTRLGAGVDALAVWYVFVGGLALYTSVYMLGYERILPRVRDRLVPDGG